MRSMRHGLLITAIAMTALAAGCGGGDKDKQGAEGAARSARNVNEPIWQAKSDG